MEVICPGCGSAIGLTSQTCSCGFEVRRVDGIYILSADDDDQGTAYVNYDSMAAYYHQTRGADNPIHVQTADFIYRTYLEHDSVVLDLGAGTGIPGFHLAKHGVNYIAGDVSAKMLEVFKCQVDAAGLSNVTFMVMNALDIPLSADSVDAVTVRAVLHHIVDYGKAISEISRVLVPGGRLLLIYTDAKAFEPDYTAEVWDKFNQLVGRLGGEVCTSLGAGRKKVLAYIESIGGRVAPSEKVFSTTVERDLTNTLEIIKKRAHPSMRHISVDLNRAALGELFEYFRVKYGNDFARLVTRKEVSQGVTVVQFD